MRIFSKLFLGISVLSATAGTALLQAVPFDGMVANSAAEAKPLKSGAMAPDASLMMMDKKETTFKKALGGKPAVVIFYRGSWCPFCNRHLADVAMVSEDLKKLGMQIIAVTPDLPEDLMKAADKNKVDFTLLSDSKADLMKKFGVAFRVDDKTYMMYRDQYKIDLEKSSGQTHHILPVPSVFLVDAKGKIQFASSNPDYRVRMKSSEILEAAKKMGM